MKIDAHQHFWELARGDYTWLTPELTPLYKDFSPDELAPLLTTNDIDGTVLVQAAPTVAETGYMLALADNKNGDGSFIKGVVGWIDFEADDAIDTLCELTENPKLVGIRPMIQDITDKDWMLKPQFSPVYKELIKRNVVFDALTLPQHLKNLKLLLERHPDLNVVINHASKPEIQAGHFDTWAIHMADIATTTNAWVKLSGIVTEAGSDWTIDKLKPYVDHLLEAFGSHRIIWGSDWPVCTLASSYDKWCDASNLLLAGLSQSEQADILGHNAIRAYNLRL